MRGQGHGDPARAGKRSTVAGVRPRRSGPGGKAEHRRGVRDGSPRFDVDPGEHRAVFTRFIEAAAGGDLRALVATLDPDVVAVSDGGGQVSAAIRPVRGADRVARFLLGLADKSARRGDEVTVLVAVNGLPAIGVYTRGALTSLIIATVGEGRVVRLDIIRAPEKLSAGQGA